MVWLIIIGLQNLTWYQSYKINLHSILWPQKILLLLSPSTPWFTWLPTSYKGFRYLDPVSHYIFITRHARFDENIIPFSSSSMQPSSAISDYITFHDPISSPPVMASTNFSTGHSSQSSVTLSMPCKTCALDLPSSQSTSSLAPSVPAPQEAQPPALPIASVPHQNSHSMITRGKACISKSKHYRYVCQVPSSPLLSSLLVMKEPKGFKSAAKSLEWLAAMDEEIRALKLNQTWELVPRPSATNVVGSKWIFCTNYHLDGSIDRLKACLVAKGYT